MTKTNLDAYLGHYKTFEEVQYPIESYTILEGDHNKFRNVFDSDNSVSGMEIPIRITPNAHDSIVYAYSENKPIYLNNFFIRYSNDTYLIISGHEFFVILNDLKDNLDHYGISYISSWNQYFEYPSDNRKEKDNLFAQWLVCYPTTQKLDCISSELFYIDKKYQIENGHIDSLFYNFFKKLYGYTQSYDNQIENIKTIEKLKEFMRKNNYIASEIYLSGLDYSVDASYDDKTYKIKIVDDKIPKYSDISDKIKDISKIQFGHTYTDIEEQTKSQYVYFTNDHEIVAVKKILCTNSDCYAVKFDTQKPDKVPVQKFEEFTDIDLYFQTPTNQVDSNKYSYYITDDIITVISKKDLNNINDKKEYNYFTETDDEYQKRISNSIVNQFKRDDMNIRNSDLAQYIQRKSIRYILVKDSPDDILVVNDNMPHAEITNNSNKYLHTVEISDKNSISTVDDKQKKMFTKCSTITKENIQFNEKATETMDAKKTYGYYLCNKSI